MGSGISKSGSRDAKAEVLLESLGTTLPGASPDNVSASSSGENSLNHTIIIPSCAISGVSLSLPKEIRMSNLAECKDNSQARKDLKMACFVWNSTFGWHLDIVDEAFGNLLETPEFADLATNFSVDFNNSVAELRAEFVKAVVKKLSYLTIMNESFMALQNSFKALGSQAFELNIPPHLFCAFACQIMRSLTMVRKKKSPLSEAQLNAWRNTSWIVINTMHCGYMVEGCRPEWACLIYERLYASFFPDEAADADQDKVFEFVEEGLTSPSTVKGIKDIIGVTLHDRTIPPIIFREDLETSNVDRIFNLLKDVTKNHYIFNNCVGNNLLAEVVDISQTREWVVLTLFSDIAKAMGTSMGKYVSRSVVVGIMRAITNAVERGSSNRKEIESYIEAVLISSRRLKNLGSHRSSYVGSISHLVHKSLGNLFQPETTEARDSGIYSVGSACIEEHDVKESQTL
eukprot:Nk52_evm5s279 gene=Nk52_evmTU5s279